MLITIFGSCRQDSLYKKYNVTCIHNKISYPHYSKEIIQLLNYCLYNDLHRTETFIFRTPTLTNSLLTHNIIYKESIINSDVVFIEIASRKYYKINDRYAHHILYDDNKYNTKTKDKIQLGELTDYEIREDIIDIISKIPKKKIIMVTHLVTKNEGKRYELANSLKKICDDLKIYCIEPVKEFEKRGYNLNELIKMNESTISHYTEKGHTVILEIYQDYITKMDI